MKSEMHLQLVAILLRRGTALDHASSVLTLFSIVIGLTPLFGMPISPMVSAAAIVMLLVGIAEKYWAQRVAIDTELFSALATRANHLDDAVKQLDIALHDLGLAPAVATARSMAERSHGALRLLRMQAICLGAQCLVAVAACIAACVVASQ